MNRSFRVPSWARLVGLALMVVFLFLLVAPAGQAQDADAAGRTLAFTAQHAGLIDYLNLAVFNLPAASEEAGRLKIRPFYEGDLSLYADFEHPSGWGRREVRGFLDRKFRRHPAVAPIMRRQPPFFTSNHAPFLLNFC